MRLVDFTPRLTKDGGVAKTELFLRTPSCKQEVTKLLYVVMYARNGPRLVK